MATEASLPTIPAKTKSVRPVDRLEALAAALAFGAFSTYLTFAFETPFAQ